MRRGTGTGVGAGVGAGAGAGVVDDTCSRLQPAAASATTTTVSATNRRTLTAFIMTGTYERARLRRLETPDAIGLAAIIF